MTTDAIASESLLACFNVGRCCLERISILLTTHRDVMFDPVHAVGLRLTGMARLAPCQFHHDAERQRYFHFAND
jgi:hypothetical protein